MSLIQIGQVLSQEREQQGLDLRQVSKMTCISREKLKAIEEGNESLFKAKVHVRGFIQSYSKVLGLPDEKLLELLDSQTFEHSLSSIQKVENLDRSWNKIFTLSNIFLSSCIIFFSGSIFWMHWTLDQFEKNRAIQSTTDFLPLEKRKSLNFKGIQVEKILGSQKEESNKTLQR